ncbi:MAG TPA: AraC family transcriptional regulator [Clostridiales bacterium]|nr:AraC family transcriptional regulator [Clostridiales bacterium]
MKPMLDRSAITGMNFGSVVYPVNGTLGPRIQSDWQLVLLHSGWVKITIDDRQLLLEPGEVCLLEPGHREYFQFSQESPSWHRWIALRPVSPDACPELKISAWQLKIRIITGMNQMMDNLMQLQQAGLPDDHPSMLHIGMAAVELYRTAANPAASSALRHPALDHMMNYIRLNYSGKIGLADLAGVAGLSREYLIRLCRQYNRMTPMQMLWDYRCQQGLNLLNGSGLTVSTIAESCGFAAACHFSRMIRSRTGQAPGQIRRQALQLE